MPPVTVNDFLAHLKAKLGIPYVWGGVTLRGLDCSGLIWLSAAELGLFIQRTSQGMYFSKQIPHVKNPLPGDLVYINNGTREVQPGHIGVYIGPGLMLNAPYTGTVVRYDIISPGSVMAYGRLPFAQVIAPSAPPLPTPPPMVSDYSEVDMKSHLMTLPARLDKDGNGYYSGPSLGIPDVNAIVSVTWITEPPNAVGRYDKLPDSWAIDAQNHFVVNGGTPNAQYGCVIWTR